MKAPIDQALDAPPDRREQRRGQQRGTRNGQRIAGRHRAEERLQAEIHDQERRDQERGDQAIGKRSAADPVDVVEAVAQDRDADGDRGQEERNEPAKPRSLVEGPVVACHDHEREGHDRCADRRPQPANLRTDNRVPMDIPAHEPDQRADRPQAVHEQGDREPIIAGAERDPGDAEGVVDRFEPTVIERPRSEDADQEDSCREGEQPNREAAEATRLAPVRKPAHEERSAQEQDQPDSAPAMIARAAPGAGSRPGWASSVTAPRTRME